MNIASLFEKKYYPLNSIDIFGDKIVANYTYLSQLSEQQIAPVLKSNAYGHGLAHIGKILDTVHAPFFCVDSLYEAYELHKAKITTPILIMGYINPFNITVKRLPFSYVAYDIDLLEALHKYQPGSQVHIFVDTGMHREGIPLDDLADFLTEAKKYPNVTITGLMSHFGDANDLNNPLTLLQIDNFQKAQEIMNEKGITVKWKHISASGGVLHLQKYREKLGNVARVGIALYGYDPKEPNIHLQPSIQLLTTLAQMKTLRKGEKVGYDFTFTAEKDMTIGILPIGYFDGIDRRLSNVGFVEINKTMCKILGKVSMNITIVDLSNVNDAAIGQKITVYAPTIETKHSLYHAAQLCETIPYELLVHLSSTTKRKIV